jgi:hypothetical protein
MSYSNNTSLPGVKAFQRLADRLQADGIHWTPNTHLIFCQERERLDQEERRLRTETKHTTLQEVRTRLCGCAE